MRGDVKYDFDIPLGPLTLILGEEASGKTSIALAIRLALTGTFEGTGKLPSELIKLAARRDQGISVELEFPNGRTRWQLPVDAKTGKAKTPKPPTYEGELSTLTEQDRYCIIPTDAANEFLKSSRGDKKIREAFLRRFGGSASTEVPEPVGLRSSELKIWQDAVKEMKDEGWKFADEICSRLSEHFDKKAGEWTKRIKPIEASVEARKSLLAQVPKGSERLNEWKAEREKAVRFAAYAQDRKELEEAKARRDQVQALIAEHQKERDAVMVDWKAAESWGEDPRFVELDIKRDSLEDERIAVIKKIGSSEIMIDVYAARVQDGRKDCPFGGGLACGDPADHLKVHKERLASRNARLVEIEGELTRIAEKWNVLAFQGNETVIQLDCKAQTLLQAISRLQGEESSLTYRITSLETKLREGGKGAETYTGPSVAEWDAKINPVVQALAARTELNREAGQIRDMQEEREIFKRLAGEAKFLGQNFMDDVAKIASDEVSQGMPGGRRAVFDINEYEWKVIRPDDEEFYYSTASGTEQTNLKFAFAGAWTRGSPLRIGIFDDYDLIGLTKKGMQDFFKKCEEAVSTGDFHQIIVVWNRPDEAPSAGWTIHKV